MRELLTELDALHTTELGDKRIRNNLKLNVSDVIEWCREQIKKEDAVITRKGKNFYIYVSGCVITVNAYSFTIITAHKNKKNM